MEWKEAFEHTHYNESSNIDDNGTEGEEQQQHQNEGKFQKKKTGYYETYRDGGFRHDSWKQHLEAEVSRYTQLTLLRYREKNSPARMTDTPKGKEKINADLQFLCERRFAQFSTTCSCVQIMKLNLPVYRKIGKSQNPFFALFEQNWRVSDLESVRIGKCQNWKVSEAAWYGEYQNWKLSETAWIGNCQKLLRLESGRI